MTLPSGYYQAAPVTLTAPVTSFTQAILTVSSTAEFAPGAQYEVWVDSGPATHYEQMLVEYLSSSTLTALVRGDAGTFPALFPIGARMLLMESGGGGTGAVSSVDTRTGAVTLDDLYAPIADGVQTGGTIHQVYTKLSSTDNDADWETPAPAGVTSVDSLTGAVDLSSVYDAYGAAASETSRAETAEGLLAPEASPSFTGNPTGPTKTPLDNSVSLATTAYSDAAVGVETSRAEGVESGLQATSAKGSANGYASLDSGGKIPSGQLPAITVNNTYVSTSQASMLALGADVGDTCVRSDISATFILQALPASTLGNWIELEFPAPVTSVDGLTGAVSLSASYLPINNPGMTGVPTAPTAAALTDSVQVATTAYADSAVGVETSRAEGQEALAALRANDLSDLANAATARSNLGLATIAASGSASDLGTGTMPTGRYPGGGFNSANELVQLDGSTRLPAVDGSQLTNLPVGAVDGGSASSTYGGISGNINGGGA